MKNNENFVVKYSTLVMINPLIHVIANITTNYFPSGTLNPGFVRTIYLFIIILYYLFVIKIPRSKLFFLIVGFLFYNLILVLKNEDLTTPLINYTRLFLAFFMPFIGYFVIKNRQDLSLLLKYYVIALFFFILNYVIANIFKLGSSTYIEDSFYIGGAGVGSANELAIFLLVGIVFILVNKHKFWNRFTIFLIIGSAIILLISLRRGAFLILGGAFFIYSFVVGLNFKIIKYIILFSALLILSFPLYDNLLIERYNYRVQEREGSLANYEIEGRFLELQEVPASLTREKSWLTGTHNLNSSAYFGARSLHVGYMGILHGSGLIGLFLFLSIILTFITRGIVSYKKYRIRAGDQNKEGKLLFALYLSLLISILIYLLTSRLHGFHVMVPCFLLMGAILKYLDNQKKINMPELF